MGCGISPLEKLVTVISSSELSPNIAILDVEFDEYVTYQKYVNFVVTNAELLNNWLFARVSVDGQTFYVEAKSREDQARIFMLCDKRVGYIISGEWYLAPVQVENQA